MDNETSTVIAVGIMITIAALAVGPWLIMVLWGALASIFGFTTISFWEAVVVYLALCLVRVILS